VTPDPLSVTCPRCEEPPGNRCGTINAYSRRPHVARVKLALAHAAHADTALDAWFSRTNPCGICGVPGMPQRHRVVDAIAGMLAAGENPQVVAEQYGVTAGAVRAVQAWAARWPGAWE